jgi:hypothetical protein
MVLRSLTYSSGNAGALRGIVNLVREVSQDLLVLPADLYADLVLGMRAIENQLDIWTARGDIGLLTAVRGVDLVLLIWRALSKCPDEYPPPATAELTFISDITLRDSIRGDIGAAERAVINYEWKAATVMAGRAIEALLHWRLDQSPPIAAEISQSVAALLAGCGKSRPICRDIGYNRRCVTRCGDVRCAVGIRGATRCSAM